MKDLKGWFLRRAGILLTILSSFSHATGNLFSKYISTEVSTLNIVAIRYIFQCIFAAPFLLKDISEMRNITKWEWLFIVLSGFFQMLSSSCAFLALAILPIMDATTLIKIQPIFVNIISWLWLKELITWLDAMMTAVLMAGVLLVCQPDFIFNMSAEPDNSYVWIGQILAIVAAFTAGVATCMVRRVRNAGTPIILFWQGAVIVGLTVIPSLILGDQKEPSAYWAIGFLLCAALGEALYRVFLTGALMVEESAIVASFQTVEIIFSLIYEVAVYDEIPGVLGLVGAALIIAGVVVLALKYKILMATRCQCCNYKKSFEESCESCVDETKKLLPGS